MIRAPARNHRTAGDAHLVNKDDPGVYNVTYFILLEDYGLYVQKQRTVTVVDTQAPVISLAGDLLIGIQAGTSIRNPVSRRLTTAWAILRTPSW